jgi:hypothetical protein
MDHSRPMWDQSGDAGRLASYRTWRDGDDGMRCVFRGSFRRSSFNAITLPGPASMGKSSKHSLHESSSNDLSIVREELFDPVLAVQRFIARTKRSGSPTIPSTVWARGCGPATSAAPIVLRSRLRAGLVWVNCYADRDVSVPFGGVRQSGSGRDKSLHALDGYSDLKTTWIDLRD